MASQRVRQEFDDSAQRDAAVLRLEKRRLITPRDERLMLADEILEVGNLINRPTALIVRFPKRMFADQIRGPFVIWLEVRAKVKPSARIHFFCQSIEKDTLHDPVFMMPLFRPGV